MEKIDVTANHTNNNQQPKLKATTTTKQNENAFAVLLCVLFCLRRSVFRQCKKKATEKGEDEEEVCG